MANAQAMCTSFKYELLNGTHLFYANASPAQSADTFKIALYTTAATNLNATTTTYGIPSGELAAGGGYASGGISLTIVPPTTTPISDSTGTAFLSFANVSWGPSATWVGVQYALIYNSSKSNKAVAVLNFGSGKDVTNSTFTVQMPTVDATNAIIRIQ
jgi:hypothetical protein